MNRWVCVNKTVIGLVLTAVLSSFAGSAWAAKSPKLILQITVDGLRGDLPFRYRDRFGKGGFLYLMGSGTIFTNAHYRYANNETIVGHTTLATGAFPADHGMIGNLWLDQDSGQLTYNIEDPNYSMVGQGVFVDQETELDPTQRAARSEGRSPRTILSTTFSDELLLATNGRAKVFSVSVKDRGAVPLAGHDGKAFWFNKKSGEFISSTFYYSEYPAWVTSWNSSKHADQYRNSSWELVDSRENYLLKDRDDRDYEIDLFGYQRTFPHPFGDDPRSYYTLLTLSPVGDILTLDFTKELITGEKLGSDDIPDYLAVSFSSTDYINHMFGPGSLEMEDNLLQLDRRLAELFTFIDEKVGLDETLIVLSADHGTPEAPEQMAELGMQTRRISPERLELDCLYKALRTKFGVGKELIKTYYHPYIYLDRALIVQKGLDQKEVESALVDELIKFPGIAAAISSLALQKGDYINETFSSYVKNNFNPHRSGDIFVIQEPYNHLVSDETTPLAAMHGSPWKYDTYVPIMFAGLDLPAKVVARLVHPADIAATLANYMKIKPPAAATGEVLSEIYAPKQD